MKRLATIILAVLLCETVLFASSHSFQPESDIEQVKTISSGPIYCVEAWDIFKNREFQKTSYLAGRV
nr:hypothetical protein [uncultured Oscillibacter sp.]